MILPALTWILKFRVHSSGCTEYVRVTRTFRSRNRREQTLDSGDSIVR